MRPGYLQKEALKIINDYVTVYITAAGSGFRCTGEIPMKHEIFYSENFEQTIIQLRQNNPEIRRLSLGMMNFTALTEFVEAIKNNTRVYEIKIALDLAQYPLPSLMEQQMYQHNDALRMIIARNLRIKFTEETLYEKALNASVKAIKEGKIKTLFVSPTQMANYYNGDLVPETIHAGIKHELSVKGFFARPTTCGK